MNTPRFTPENAEQRPDDPKAGRIAELEQRARSGVDGMIISESIDEHFDVIVEAMDVVGARRQGAVTIRAHATNGIVVKYLLPNGRLILAGY